VGYKQSDFVNQAIARAIQARDAGVFIAPQIETKEDKPAAEEKPAKQNEKEFANPYEEFLNTWKQGDILPLIPPGKSMHLCKFGNPRRIDTNYFDLMPEYRTKKPKVKFKHNDLTLDSKSLGPKLRDEIDTLLSRAMMGRFGLKPWVDDKNKLRCPEGTPAANQFTDQRMSNCFVISPATMAQGARRMARRAGAAATSSAQMGERTRGGFEGARDLANLTQQDFIDMGYDEVSSLMASGGRIVGAMTGGRYDPARRAPAEAEPYLLGRKEKLARGKRATELAKITSQRIALGLDRLPNGEVVGDIRKRENFLNAMKQLFPHLPENEILNYFEQAIPAGMTFEERIRARRAFTQFWESTIAEIINNPELGKWVTKFETDYNMGDAFQMVLDHFPPAIDDKGRYVSGVGQKLTSGRNAAQGGVHVAMRINPRLLYASSLDNRDPDARAIGFWDSVQGDMHYTATHEVGHLAHFASAMQALGFDVNRLSRYQVTPTGFTPSRITGAGAQWLPRKENNAWIIDFTNMQNPLNSPSIQLVMDAARNLQTRQYAGGRGMFNSNDLKRDLENFYEAFNEAVVNNVTDTPEELELMRAFAGGEYAASHPVEARAEYYAARRLFGETNEQGRLLSNRGLSRQKPFGYGPVNPQTRNRNYVEDFANAMTSGPQASKPFQKFRAPLSTVRNISGKTPQEVMRDLDNIGRHTFQVRPGTWNITGAMQVGGQAPRVSLHAEHVRRAVRNNETRSRRKRPEQQSWQPLTRDRGATAITGRMAAKKDEIHYPREATYGSFLGEAQKIFGGAKTWEEFKKIYDETEVVYFDYETTGIEHDADGRTVDKGDPVQIGAVRMKGDKVLDRLNVFMKPDKPLGEWSAKYLKDKEGNTLTDDWLSGQVSKLKAHQMLAEFAGENAIFGVQYAPFDKDVLDATLEKLGIQWRPSGYIDTKDVAEHTLPRWTPENPEGPSKLVKEKILEDGTVIPETRKASNGLADITQYLGVDLGSKHHTADADSEAAGKVMAALIDKAIEKNLPTTVLDMNSQGKRVAEAKDRFEKELIEFERFVAEKNAEITGSMSVGRQLASSRASDRKTKQIKEEINKYGGNFGGDTSLKYIDDVKPENTLLGPTAERSTRDQRIAERKSNITQLRALAASFVPNENQPQVAAAAPPGNPPPPDFGPNDPNRSPQWDALSKMAAQEALNGLNPEFYRYLIETNVEELEKDLNAAIMDFHDGLDSQPRTHVNASKLKDVIENGFKNSHQTNRISGLNKVLAKYEADIGIHPDTPAELRPASGIVLHSDEVEREQRDILRFLENSDKSDPERYFPNLVDYPHSRRTRGNNWNFGSAEIILKPGVSDRTAYGNGDLFNNHIEPVSLGSTDIELITRAHVDSSFKTDNRAENIIEHLYNRFKDDHNAYRREKYAISPGRSWEPREALIAGGFDASDIDEVRIQFDSVPENFISNTSEEQGPDFIKNMKRSLIGDNDFEAMGLNEEEKFVVGKILESKPDSYVIPDSLQKQMNRFGADEKDIKLNVDKFVRLRAARDMKDKLEEMGITLSVTNKYGLNIFDPRTFDKNAKKTIAAEDALRQKIIEQIVDIMNERRNAQWMIDGMDDDKKPLIIKYKKPKAQ
jgi:DNA polymerase III epsilon subunit-like protein